MDIGSQEVIPEEFHDQMEWEVKKFAEYASDDKEFLDHMDSLLESKQMTIQSFRDQT